MSPARLLGACATLAALLAGGCVEDQESLIVLGAPAWEVSMSAAGCVVNPSVDTYLSFGVLDMHCLQPGACQMLAPIYWIPVALQNNLGAEGGDPSTAELQLKEVEVSYSIPQEPDLVKEIDEGLRHFTLPLATDSLPPNSPKGVVVEAINPQQAQEIYRVLPKNDDGSLQQATLLVKLVFHAERTATSGDFGVVESRAFEFPITICEGCLFSCEPCEGSVCPQSNPDELTWAGGVCGNAQDGPLFPTVCSM